MHLSLGWIEVCRPSAKQLTRDGFAWYALSGPPLHLSCSSCQDDPRHLSFIQERSHLLHNLGDKDEHEWCSIEKVLEDNIAEVRFSALLALCALGAAGYSLMNAVFCWDQ